MGKRKGASSRGRELFDTVASAGRSALKEAQRRLPPDLKEQIEHSLRTMRVELAKTASQADLTRLSRRIDQLAKRIDEIAKEGTGSARARPRRTASRSSNDGSTRRRTGPARSAGSGRSSTARTSTRTSRSRKPPSPPPPAS
jgi:hypothetical protein